MLPDIVLGAGALGLVLSFTLAVLKIMSQDKGWKDLQDTLRQELNGCRDGREEQRKAHAVERAEWRAERAELITKVQTLEGELIALRREVHHDWWLGVTRVQRTDEGEQGEPR